MKVGTITTPNAKGQIVIPKAMRETLGIERGDELVIIQIDNKILLEKTQKIEQKI